MRDREAGVRRFVGVLAVAAVVALGCEHSPTATVIHAAKPRTALAALVGGFSEVPYVNLSFGPTAMEFSPDGRLFVSDQAGSLRVVRNGALLPTPFVTLNVDATVE